MYPLEKVCGKWVMPATEAHHKDSSDLMAILSVRSITMLNSWNRPTHRQLATFTFGQLASQVDYPICRQGQATHSAKQAAILQQFPVAAWRVPIPEHRWPKAEQPKIPKLDTTTHCGSQATDTVSGIAGFSRGCSAWDTTGTME